MCIKLIQHWRFPAEGYGNRGKLHSPGHVRQVDDELGEFLCSHIIGDRPIARRLDFNVASPKPRGLTTHIEVELPDWAKALDLDYGVNKGLAWELTMIWDGVTPLRFEMVPIGFDLLERWDIACPVRLDRMAADVGSANARKRTKRLIHDLRIPIYDPSLLFVRDSPEAREVLRLWEMEAANITRAGDSELAFLRALALAKNKPLILALPPDWFAEVEP